MTMASMSSIPTPSTEVAEIKAVRRFNRFYTRRIGILDPYLDSDTVFGVKDSLVRPFRPAGHGDPPDVSYVTEMDFSLAAQDDG